MVPPEYDFDIAKFCGLKGGEMLSHAYQAVCEGKQLIEYNYNALDYQSVSIELASKRKNEFQFCIQAVILFQVSMEAIINQVITTKPEIQKFIEDSLKKKKKWYDATFKDKWCKTLEKQKIELENFEKYHENIYRTLRNNVVHPRHRYSGEKPEKLIFSADKFIFSNVYSGFKNGWLAFASLSQAVGYPHDNNSWDIYCDICHLPKSLVPEEYPNLTEKSNFFLNEYMNHIATINNIRSEISL
ncbi:hypothetical protein [Anabaena sp. UHCC 0451]|uniref:hypothetical protein n=1 Tax=Anabaena sp. UHCC 0451 TaxID=2055235 RepID=UPI002B203B4E|nr:hypothetical protein [Anabaena sp. UHCC 0451]MEA5575741.1 hypothetical protein [Anabaena sp. UHCC 0451]